MRHSEVELIFSGAVSNYINYGNEVAKAGSASWTGNYSLIWSGLIGTVMCILPTIMCIL